MEEYIRIDKMKPVQVYLNKNDKAALLLIMEKRFSKMVSMSGTLRWLVKQEMERIRKETIDTPSH